MSSVARSSLKLSFYTVISRVLGLARDHYQAVFFGTGPIAAAWEIAFLLPNMLRNLLAEGVLAQSFIPIYSEGLRESEESAREAAGVILGFLFCFLLLLVALGIAVFPFVLPAFAGQAVGETALLVDLSRIMFVFIMTASLTAIFSGIANAHLLFTVPALSPILLNIVLISGYLLLGLTDLTPQRNAEVLAVVVSVGGVLQLLMQALYIWMRGLWPAIQLRLRHPALRKLGSLMAPAVLGASLFQLNQLFDIAIAGWFIDAKHGAVPGLRFAHRLIQLPTGIVGTALSTAILPALAAALRDPNRGNAENGRELVAALSFSAFLTVPAALGLWLLGPQIIDLLFYGGEWRADSSATVWVALRFYALGVPLYSANKILTSSFYAYQDTATPVRIMLVTVPFNFALNLSLVGPLLHGGLALSTCVTALATGTLLLRSLQKKIGQIPYAALGLGLLRQLPAYAVLALVVAGIGFFGRDLLGSTASFLHNALPGQPLPRLLGLVEVGVAVPLAGAAYIGTALLMRLPEVDVFSRFWRRRAPK